MNKPQGEFSWKFVTFVASAVLLVWVGSWVLIDWLITEDASRGAFGDKFGAVNALFSGLAFAGVIVTLLFQKRELKLQREELSYTREELAGQREELRKQGEAFIEQNQAINQQRFENTFFNLLEAHRDIVSNLPPFSRRNTSGIVTKSTPYFAAIYRDVNKAFHQHGQDALDALSRIIDLWQYFANLYRIVKYVDNSKLVHASEKYDYICILRARLSYYELWVLFYHCLNDPARKKFKPLVEKYALFNNLDLDKLFSPEDKNKYEAGAFKYTPQSK